MEKIQSTGQLLPAYPLFTKDPFFSVWSPSDKLNESDTIFWTGMRRRTYGLVYCDGETYAFMGIPECAKRLTQTNVEITAFSTIYTFTSEKFDLKVSFISPLPLRELDVMACPVCYVTYAVTPKQKIEKFSVSIALHEDFCYDKTRMPVRGGVYKLGDYQSAWFGLKKQLMMSQSTDSSAAEWGDWYVTGEKAMIVNHTGFMNYVSTGNLDFICEEWGDKYIVACNEYFDISSEFEGKLTVAFDDGLSIFYFGEWLKGYWFENGKTIYDAIRYSYENYDYIISLLDAYDDDLKQKAVKYGEDYLHVLYAGLRQSIAAHKLVKTRKGDIVFLSKENHSNGCIATVDVSYPSTPLYLLYNPELVKGMLIPVLEFAQMPVWTYDFAPHDVGTYPYVLGQVYAANLRRPAGGKWKGAEHIFYNCQNHAVENQPNQPYTYPYIYSMPNENGELFNFDYQMPVEECGNMLVMIASTIAVDGDTTLARKYFNSLKTWVKYLKKYGLMPGNQLCTDDFAGHLDKNINLSVKAIVGIRAYAYICEKLGKNSEAIKWKDLAEVYAAKWKENCVTPGKQTPLVFDGDENTFALKYNMAFDVMFGSNLFDESIREREVDYYISASNQYGVPLDSRSTFTKSDWILWATTLTSDIEKRKKLIAPIAKFLRESLSRAPFTDWYFTDSGFMRGFQNRSVQGGLFAPLLADSGLVKFEKEE